MTNTNTPKPTTFPAEAATHEHAALLDAADPLREFRDKFIIPSKANIATKKLAKPGSINTDTVVGFMYTDFAPRSFRRVQHILRRQLSRNSAQSRVEVYGSSAGYVVLDRRLWPLHRSRGFPSIAMAAPVGTGRYLNVEDRRRTARRGCCYGDFDDEFAFVAC